MRFTSSCQAPACSQGLNSWPFPCFLSFLLLSQFEYLNCKENPASLHLGSVGAGMVPPKSLSLSTEMAPLLGSVTCFPFFIIFFQILVFLTHFENRNLGTVTACFPVDSANSFRRASVKLAKCPQSELACLRTWPSSPPPRRACVIVGSTSASRGLNSVLCSYLESRDLGRQTSFCISCNLEMTAD